MQVSVFHRNVGPFDQVAISFPFLVDEHHELRCRHWRGYSALHGDHFHHPSFLEDRDQLGANAVDDGLWRPHAQRQPPPLGDLVAGNGLADRRRLQPQ